MIILLFRQTEAGENLCSVEKSLIDVAVAGWRRNVAILVCKLYIGID